MEKDGKGKEYICGLLEFEGEYLNGERNGKGKAYNLHDRLRYDVEYSNGKVIQVKKNFNLWNLRKYIKKLITKKK